MTKIDIISGFLGAGKTTLIKKMLKEAFKGEQVVLIENEFGEIGIDGGFLKDSGIQIREMNSGCICCSLVGDFGKSLKEVVETYHPDRILIEPSGVGKLSDVIKAVQDVQGQIDAALNSFTTVVDAMKCRLYRNNFGEFFSNQVNYAGAIVLSRTDKATPEKVQESCRILRELNEKAPIITTPIAELPGDKLLEAMEHSKSLEEELLSEINCPKCGGRHGHNHGSDEHLHQGHNHGSDEHNHIEHGHSDCCDCEHDKHNGSGHGNHNCNGHGNQNCNGHGQHNGSGHGQHNGNGHHHADDIFTSWGCETINVYTKDEINNILHNLESDNSYGTVLRAKGMVAGDGEWIYFDMVPQEYEVRSGAAEYTGRVCVIGSELQEEKLSELFGIR